jgi:para-aminobenzoate synthetase
MDLTVRVLEFCPDPVDLFRAEFLASDSKFLLESSVVTPGFSRFTFLGDAGGPLGEVIRYDADTRRAIISAGGETEVEETEFFSLLKRRLEGLAMPRPATLPFDFNLGYVGFLGYELKAQTAGSPAHRSGTLDAAMIFASRLIAIDLLDRRCYLIHLVTDSASRAAADEWCERIATWVDEHRPEVERPAAAATQRKRLSLEQVEGWIGRHARMRHSKGSYLEKISASLREIVRGETYEVCLTNLIELPFNEDPFELYCVMRELSPAPHAAYLSVPDFHIVSASPERFLSIDRQGRAEAKPIKGTRPRGRTPEEDRAQVERLRKHEKDRAENLMLVDLLRNDLGQVCEIGSVSTPNVFVVESYSHAHQLVSTVRGRLKPGVSAIDCVRAAFPGGSMTGAPKKRTMEIIDRLEGGPRGAYSGALGWFGLCGACDLNIIIRSVAIDGRRARFGVGGAITALSDPEEEFAETMVKARGVVEAIAQLRGADR